MRPIGKGDIESAGEDNLLIDAVLSGDLRAFNRLVIKHRERVRHLIFMSMGDTDFADDIMQDVFISIYKNISDFKRQSKFTTWLYRVTMNKCTDYLRKKKVRNIFSPLGEEQGYQGQNQDSREIQKIVRYAITKLPERLRLPLRMRDIEGLSYKEIADELGLEEGTVKSRIFRARETLKIILQPYQKDLF